MTMIQGSINSAVNKPKNCQRFSTNVANLTRFPRGRCDNCVMTPRYANDGHVFVDNQAEIFKNRKLMNFKGL